LHIFDFRLGRRKGLHLSLSAARNALSDDRWWNLDNISFTVSLQSIRTDCPTGTSHYPNTSLKKYKRKQTDMTYVLTSDYSIFTLLSEAGIAEYTPFHHRHASSRQPAQPQASLHPITQRYPKASAPHTAAPPASALTAGVMRERFAGGRAATGAGAGAGVGIGDWARLDSTSSSPSSSSSRLRLFPCYECSSVKIQTESRFDKLTGDLGVSYPTRMRNASIPAVNITDQH
jgi:hypothetical protein